MIRNKLQKVVIGGNPISELIEVKFHRFALPITVVLNLWSANPGGPRLFRKLNNFSQQINKVYIRKKAKSEIENFKTLCKSKGI
jgi:hypothetical protein